MQNRNFTPHLFKQILSLILLTGVLSGAFSVAAQNRRVKPTSPKPTSKTAAVSGAGGDNQYKTCNGGWSGVITYKKVLDYREDFGKQKRLPHGTTHNKVSHDYKYTGRIVVDGSKNPNLLEAKGQVSLNDVRKNWRRHDQKDTCFYDGKKESVPQWSEKDESDVTNAFGEGEAGFSIWVNQLEGTYSFSFRFPDAQGTNDREYKQTAGGWCNPKNNEPVNNTAKYPIRIDGGGAEIKDQKIDPERPDVLSGSKTWEQDTTLKSSKFVYTVTWHFKRCPAPVEVTDVRFDEHPYPNVNQWKEIPEGADTIDGNLVRIRARVVNFSGETRFPTIKFSELVENWQLPEGETSIRLEAGEERELELEWDTSGYAWKGKGWDAESSRKIKVEAIDEARVSQMTKPVIVSPRPVILVHGLWSNAAAWNGYEKFFEEAHSAYWKSFAVGSDPKNGLMKTGEKFGSAAPTFRIEQNALELRQQIEFARKDLNAWHVDIVAHSMGGLIARRYIHDMMIDETQGKKPIVTRLLMLGTPNTGSPCADLMYATMATTGNRLWTLWELKPENMEKFNRLYRNRRGVRFSALVGRAIPQTCQASKWGDGVVTIDSAKWEVRDWRYSNSLAHTDLTSRADFGAFVFPRLSIGPRGNHDIELVAERDFVTDERLFAKSQRGDSVGQIDRYGFNLMFRKAAYQKEASSTLPQTDETEMGEGRIEGLTLAKEVRLQAKQSSEIEIPMRNANRASIVFLAPPNVSATLVDPSGGIVGKNLAGTPESRQIFRTISVEKPVAEGSWKLKLESKESTETSVFVAAFADTDPLAFELAAGKPTATRQIFLTAKLTDNNSPVTGAVVKARIQSESGGSASELTFYDDGAHNDGAAGDGVYGAAAEKLADGAYLVEAKAETNAKIRFAVLSFNVGAQKNNAFQQPLKRAKK